MNIYEPNKVSLDPRKSVMDCVAWIDGYKEKNNHCKKSVYHSICAVYQSLTLVVPTPVISQFGTLGIHETMIMIIIQGDG